MLDDFAFNLQADAAERGRRPVTLVNGSDDDMLRLGASLERIPGAYKAEMGAWLLKRLEKAGTAKRPTRTPCGRWPASARASPSTAARTKWSTAPPWPDWLAVLLALDWKKIEPAAFAAAHLARMTGDRSRDIGDALRATILPASKAWARPASWVAMVREVVQLDEASTKRMLGEALPPGLKLLA